MYITSIQRDRERGILICKFEKCIIRFVDMKYFCVIVCHFAIACLNLMTQIHRRKSY